MRILVTGGAGYIGTSLVPELLARLWNVRVFDNLMYDNGVILPWFKNTNFEFIKGDIRDFKQVQKAVKGCDIIVHLAAIVGFTACRIKPGIARETNVLGTTNVINAMNDKQVMIHASTGSNYGVIEGICTEESPLNPQSIYAETKVEAEEQARLRTNTIILRFATAFGVSPRLRLDLLINDFTYVAYNQQYIVVYESHFMRTFAHVRDIVRSIIMTIEKRVIMRGNIYNIGSATMNMTKRDICEIIRSNTKVYVHYADFDLDADKRDYLVGYDKIKALGYNTTITIEEGVKELIKIMPTINIRNKYRN